MIKDTLPGCDLQPKDNASFAILIGDHTVSLEIRPESITGTFDGDKPPAGETDSGLGPITFSRTVLAPPPPKTGFFGLTAAATAGSSAHIITAVKVETCR